MTKAKTTWLIILLSALSPSTHAENAACSMVGRTHNQGPIVITNVNIFDGKSRNLIKNAQVLIDYVRTPDSQSLNGSVIKGYDVGYFIKEVSKSGSFVTLYQSAMARTIDGKGLTLMPGLIDTHVHLSWADINPIIEFSKLVYSGLATFADWPKTGEQASLNEAKKRLLDGFTTVREVGGVSHLIKDCIDPSRSPSDNRAHEGVIGPRIWYSGSVISPTGGHADVESELEDKFHFIKDLNAMTASQREDLVLQADNFGLYKADGIEGVAIAVRTQFTKDAQFIKIATGGGVVSPHDPIDATIMTDNEVDVATQITDGMNTYTTTHAFEGGTILRDIRHGVQMVEHANLINEKAMRLVKSKQHSRKTNPSRDTSVWLNVSPFFNDAYDGSENLSGYNLEKLRIVERGTLNAFALAKKYNVTNMGWGSDAMFLNGGGQMVALPILAQMPISLEPLKHFKIDGTNRYKDYSYSNLDILKMVTYNNGLVLTKSGLRTPYQGVDGTYLKEALIGFIGPNAVADLILVEGNPLEDLSLFKEKDEKGFSSKIKLIMKDGIIYKNTLQ